MPADNGDHGIGTLIVAVTVAVVGVSFLTGWIQIVLGSLCGMIVVAVAAGRYLKWYSAPHDRDTGVEVGNGDSG